MLDRMRQFIIRQKLRLQMGQQVVGIANFILLCGMLFGKKWLWLLAPAAFAALWSLGYILDRWVRIVQAEEQEVLKRSYGWPKVLADLDEIKRRLG